NSRSPNALASTPGSRPAATLRRPSHQAVAKAIRYMIPYQWTAGWNVRPNSSNAGNWIAMGSIWCRWIMERRVPLPPAVPYCARAMAGPRARAGPASPPASVGLATQPRVALGPQVEHLHQHREAHRAVDVALRDVHVEALEQQVRSEERRVGKEGRCGWQVRDEGKN